MLIVQKFGGTSLMDDGRVLTAAGRALQRKQQGDDVVVVVSAQGHTTDQLLSFAQSFSSGHSGREMDAYLAAGEQMSAALMAMAIKSLGG